ncbi:pro-FMRFamide-related neuropeptide VF [Bombina bombina]|uniref:pro-FMRFamide-related neuropeptide VF n=1 Tax=Bombina bombina TaxID=8345 RepID=UPI00235A5EE9|nr:pro-FMRFamide-related neuropeptide VF [Bombina bombina]
MRQGNIGGLVWISAKNRPETITLYPMIAEVFKRWDKLICEDSYVSTFTSPTTPIQENPDLGVFAIFFASAVCLDENSVTNQESEEKYDNLLESREDINNINSEEVNYWRSSGLKEISTPTFNKYTFPIQLERAFLEERDIKPSVNLPLRFGRASADKVAKSVPNLPQRFARYLSGKARFQSAVNLPQRFGRSIYGGHFVQPLSSLPLRFGRTPHFQTQQYDVTVRPLEINKLQEGDNRLQSMSYDFERKLQK